MTITRKQTIVALIFASSLTTNTALAQQATSQAPRQQSINQVVNTAETGTSEPATDRPRTVATSTPLTTPNKPVIAPAPELAAVIPSAPKVLKRSATAIEIPVDLRTAHLESRAAGSSTVMAADERRIAGNAPGNTPGEVKVLPKAEPKYEARMVTSTAQVGSTFGYRSDPFTGRAKFHAGCDIKAHWGESVGASLGGTVQYAGWYHGYGNIIIISHGGGVTTHYAHLSSFDIQVGQRVERGQIIGRAGSTGRATSAHLHYEVRIDGNPVNPFQPLALDPSSDFFKLNPTVTGKLELPKQVIRLLLVP